MTIPNYYTYDEELLKKFDHIDLKRVNDKDWLVYLYLSDGRYEVYGYYNYEKAKAVVNQIVDDNVDYKFPFLKEPLKAENVNIDGAINLMSETLKSTRYAYINKARALRRLGYTIPASSEEYKKSGIDKRRIEDIEIAKRSLSKMDPIKDEYIYKKVRERLYDLENGSNGIYSIIKFMENGAMGSLHILNGGLSAQDIMNEWKKEALGYGNYTKCSTNH